MKSVKVKYTSKLAKVLDLSLALRLRESELNRLEVLVKILHLNDREINSLLFWRNFYKKYPMFFDFVVERS